MKVDSYDAALKRYLAFAFLWSLLFCWLVEFLLLEKKYGVLSGGFLQVHALVSPQDRFTFAVLSVVLDFVFWSIVAIVWWTVSRRLRVRPWLAAYNLFWASALAFGGAAGLKYKVFSYFGDGLTLQLTRALGGGRLEAAIFYVADESMIVFYGLLAAAAAYVFGYWRLDRNMSGPAVLTAGRPASLVSDRVRILVFAVVAFGAVSLVLKLANGADNIRYYLAKKTSFYVFNSLFAAASDLDGDGFGIYGYPRDPAPFDANIYPGALDIPNNGIDEDGLLGDYAPVSPATDQGSPATETDPQRNLILFVIESGRHDLVGKAVSGDEVAPVANALGRNGSRLEYVYSNVGFTTPSLKAIFAGDPFGERPSASLFSRLKQKGYEISVFSGQDESFGGMDRVTGIKQNADVFFDGSVAPNDRVSVSADPGSIRLDEARVLREILARIERADWRKKQFMYINFQAGHFPYRHPGMPELLKGPKVWRDQIKSENRLAVENTYWNAIAYVDRAIGAVLSALEKIGVMRNSVVVITADHGESLFENGLLGHGMVVNDIQTRIPLVTNIPGIKVAGPLGQERFGELFLDMMAGRASIDLAAEGQGSEVFQLVGSLATPSQIAVVDEHLRRTLYDFDKEAVHYGEEDRWVKLSEVLERRDTEAYARLKRVVERWERERWRHHSS